MKTDYFLTFLETLNKGSDVVRGASKSSAPASGASMDINLVLQKLLGQGAMALVDLVKALESDPGTLITVIHQLQSFGLVDYNKAGVSLTKQGEEAAMSLPPA